MSQEQLAFFILAAAVALAFVATALLFLFKKSDVKIFAARISAITILRNPARYVRDPFGTIMQVLALTAFVLAVTAILIVLTADA